MKTNRNEEKDKNDCNMMEALIENNMFKELYSRVKQNIFYFRIKARFKLITVLKSIGLFNIVKNIVRGNK